MKNKCFLFLFVLVVAAVGAVQLRGQGFPGHPRTGRLWSVSHPKHKLYRGVPSRRIHENKGPRRDEINKFHAMYPAAQATRPHTYPGYIQSRRSSGIFPGPPKLFSPPHGPSRLYHTPRPAAPLMWAPLAGKQEQPDASPVTSPFLLNAGLVKATTLSQQIIGTPAQSVYAQAVQETGNLPPRLIRQVYDERNDLISTHPTFSPYASRGDGPLPLVATAPGQDDVLHRALEDSLVRAAPVLLQVEQSQAPETTPFSSAAPPFGAAAARLPRAFAREHYGPQPMERSQAELLRAAGLPRGSPLNPIDRSQLSYDPATLHGDHVRQYHGDPYRLVRLAAQGVRNLTPAATGQRGDPSQPPPDMPPGVTQLQ